MYQDSNSKNSNFQLAQVFFNGIKDFTTTAKKCVGKKPLFMLFFFLSLFFKDYPSTSGNSSGRLPKDQGLTCILRETPQDHSVLRFLQMSPGSSVSLQYPHSQQVLGNAKSDFFQ